MTRVSGKPDFPKTLSSHLSVLISLDVCERYVEPPEKASSPVFFFGVLVIEKLVFLSDKGKRLLKAELNDRDAKAGRSSQNSRKSQLRQLTLEGLYGQTPGEGSKIKVWIRCEKESGAMYMTGKLGEIIFCPML